MNRPVNQSAAWIYRGVWASVVSVFRVPPEPPTLPAAGEAVRSIRPSPGFLGYLKFFFWLALIPGDIIPLVAWVAVAGAIPLLGILLAPVFVLLLVVPDVLAYIAIHLRYDTTWYVFTDRSLRIRRGIWVIHETTISFENVQNVEVSQGPVQRYFGIADVIVQTAGGGARPTKGESGSSGRAHVGLLQGLDDAEAVRDVILDRVRQTRSTGLGDERANLPAPPSMSPVFSPAHLMVLRDIRDAARRLTVALGLLTIGIYGFGVRAAEAQVGGNLAAFPPAELALRISTTPQGPVASPTQFELVTGDYYRLTVTSEGDPDWRLELPDLLQNSHLRVLTINGIEVHLQGMVFRAIEFDQPGSASISFVPIRPGTYPFTIGDNPIALGLPAGQAGVQDAKRRAEGRFIVK